MIATSVILLTKNNGETLDEVLASVYSQRTSDSYEVIHVDSGSTDDTLSIAERYPCRRYCISPADFSHSATRNYAARLSQGQILVYLSADATPNEPDWLQSLTRPLQDAQVAGVYGRQIPRPGANPIEAYFLERTYSPRGYAKRLTADGRLRLADLFFSNVTSAIRKSVWERYPFDERLHMSEDQGWAREILRAGYTLVYEPKAAVLHSHSYALPRLFRRNFDSGHSLAVLLQDEKISFGAYGLQYLVREFVDFAMSGRAYALPRLAVYEVVRAAGFFLGQKAARLPRRLRSWCSDYKLYWDRFDGSPSAHNIGIRLPLGRSPLGRWGGRA